MDARTGEERSIARVGSIAAVLIGLLSVMGALTYLFLPADQRLGIEGARLLPSFDRDPTLLQLLFWQLTLIALLGIAVVPALSLRVRAVNTGGILWTAVLAVLGFAFTGAGHLLSISRLPKVAEAFVNGDPSTQAALLPIWRSSLDPQALWGYGAVGLWILVASVLALRARALPQPLAGLGIVVALLHWLIPVGLASDSQALLGTVIALFAIGSAAWYLWLGSYLRRPG
jgi:hypothetical protein